MEIYLALSIGFVGSLHCIIMCGPIAFALPSTGKSSLSKLLSKLVYNTGRIVTYSILGLFFGLAGQGIKFAGLQQGFSIAAGVTILVILISGTSFINKCSISNSIYKVISFAKGTIIKLFSVRSYSSLFMIGLLNGLLPCGLVYVALAASAVTGSALYGAMFMISFGIGTLPLMFTAAFAGSFINQTTIRKFSKAIPLAMLIVSLMLIVRGMNLGIPYVSPKADVAKNNFSKCCHPIQIKKS